MSDELEVLRSAKEETDQEVVALQEKLNLQRDAHNAVESELEKLQGTAESRKDTIDELAVAKQELIEQHQEEVTSLKSKYDKQVDELEETSATLALELSETKEALKTAEAQAADLTTRLEELQVA